MNVLVTGVKGQLGFDVVNELENNNIKAIGIDIEDLDITKKEDVFYYIKLSQCDAVIHCAAFTAVDKAEEMIEVCRNVNVEGTRNIALACQKLNLKMIYISTDYVFDGQGSHAFEVQDVKAPQNVYGVSKSDGEDVVLDLVPKHFIVRISWAFGINGHNFINTMLRLGQEKGEVSVVNDQIGSPTYTYDLAVLLVQMIQTDKYGVYHATNEGYCSWYEFAVEIFNQAKMDVKVNPVDSSAFSVKATRPKNSRLSKASLDNHGFERLPHWKDALTHYLTTKNTL